MRFFRFRDSPATPGAEVRTGVLVGGRLAAPEAVAPGFFREEGGIPDPGDLDAIVQSGRLGDLVRAIEAAIRDAPDETPDGPRPEDVRILAPLVRPPKIWCVGLNYRAHAGDLGAVQPEEPVGFLRPAASIIGPGDPVRLPQDSSEVTGEGELVVVLGRTGSGFPASEARRYVAGFTLAVDMTAVDILLRNPRFLTRAKSFDSFLSLGPCLATPDEVGGFDALPSLRASTLRNGREERGGPVGGMLHPPDRLLSFFSRDMTWRAGDVLLTGTPGAAPIADGDSVGVEVAGLGRLENPVVGSEGARARNRSAGVHGDAAPRGEDAGTNRGRSRHAA